MAKLKGTREVIARFTPYFVRRHIPPRVARHLYFNGKFQARMYGKKVLTLINTGHQIENEIYWRGFENCHEGLSTRIWAEIVRQTKPRCIWDIGASSGTYGVLAKAISPSSEVTFFEPIPKAVKMIEENLRLNKLNGIIYEAALGDFTGDGEIFFVEGTDFATSVTVNKNTTPTGSRSTKMGIKVLRADSIIEQREALVPDLVKLDVETFEPEVLRGFGQRFPEKAIFLIEILNESNAVQLKLFFPEISYNFYNIDDHRRIVKRTASLEKSDFYNYLILPKSFIPGPALGAFFSNAIEAK
jgi:FkbM family methyltransferase